MTSGKIVFDKCVLPAHLLPRVACSKVPFYSVTHYLATSDACPACARACLDMLRTDHCGFGQRCCKHCHVKSADAERQTKLFCVPVHRQAFVQVPILDLLHRHMDGKGKQAKLKSPNELQVLAFIWPTTIWQHSMYTQPLNLHVHVLGISRLCESCRVHCRFIELGMTHTIYIVFVHASSPYLLLNAAVADGTVASVPSHQPRVQAEI